MGIAEEYFRTLDFLRRRKISYQLTFSTNWIATSLKAAYRRAFGHYAGQAVLSDLAKFCWASKTTFRNPVPCDAVMLARLEGRREVFLRIQEHMRLSPEELFKIYSDQNFPLTITTEDSDG